MGLPGLTFIVATNKDLMLCWSCISLSTLLKGTASVAGKGKESGFHSFFRQPSKENCHNFHHCPWFAVCLSVRCFQLHTHTHEAAWPHTMCMNQIWLCPHVCHTVDSFPLCTPCRPNTQQCVSLCVRVGRAWKRKKKQETRREDKICFKKEHFKGKWHM